MEKKSKKDIAENVGLWLSIAGWMKIQRKKKPRKEKPTGARIGNYN